MLSLIAVCSSCVLFIDGVVGKGQIVQENIPVTQFNTILASSSAEVTVVEGTTFEVSLSDYENLIEYWDIKVVENTLLIQTKPFSSLVNSKAKVAIVMPAELKEVKLAGSGSIKLNDAFPTVEKASVSGSGDITGNVSTAYNILTLGISGSGSISFSGTAEELKAVTSGSGNMKLSGLQAKNATCTITGSGSMYVSVVEQLKAVVSGSGSVIYSGNPTVDVQITGSGKVRHK